MVRYFSKREKGENSSEKFVARNRALLRDFDLSRNKSLRTLEITGGSIYGAEGTTPDFLMTVLSSVASPAPVDVVIIYEDFDFDALSLDWCSYYELSICFCYSTEMRKRDPVLYQQNLDVSIKVYSTWGFRLVLCADVCESIVEDAIQELEDFVEVGKMEGGLSHFPYKPLIISERRLPRAGRHDYRPGWLRKSFVAPGSAL